jgi:hypothetical protein
MSTKKAERRQQQGRHDRQDPLGGPDDAHQLHELTSCRQHALTQLRQAVSRPNSKVKYLALCKTENNVQVVAQATSSPPRPGASVSACGSPSGPTPTSRSPSRRSRKTPGPLRNTGCSGAITTKPRRRLGDSSILNSKRLARSIALYMAAGSIPALQFRCNHCPLAASSTPPGPRLLARPPQRRPLRPNPSSSSSHRRRPPPQAQGVADAR